MCAGCAAAWIDARPGLQIGVGGSPKFCRVLYGSWLRMSLSWIVADHDPRW